jgi:signal peptidase I
MEPVFAVNSFVVTHDTSFEDVEIGDVVSFAAAGLNGQVALHRVIAIQGESDTRQLVVKGDNNPNPDGAPVTSENYLGKVVFHTSVTALFLSTLYRPYGVVFAIIVPIIILALIFFGSRWVLAGVRDWRAKAIIVCGLGMVISGAVFASYIITTTRTVDATNTQLAEIAAEFAASPVDTSWNVQDKNVLGVIEIPKIGITYPVIPYVSATSLNISITHFDGVALNMPGNAILAGHRMYGSYSPFNVFFTKIDTLQAGDEVMVTGADRQKTTYHVTGYKIVEPTDTSVLDQPTDGKKHLTLISCSYDLLDRAIITAIAD